jgi:predicted ATPase/class 3 adenylate cyclase
VQNIELWLAELGLEKYIPAFTEAEIDFQTLPELNEDDLKELGLPLGPRRKITGAIAQIGRSSAEPRRATEALEVAQSAEQLAPTSEVERRHLTVMFVDLVGSTELATKIDPEDMRNVITNYQNVIAGVATRYEGFVAKFMGDGVLCYFGWPRANEDDAERAVRAGLAMIAAISQTSDPSGNPLSTRVGIATGVVIVGDLIGSGATQEAAVVGETPNLAARLQSLAQPNQLLLPKETQSLLGDIYELEPMGAHNLKGIAEPVDAFLVIGENTRESRFAARQMGMLTPIVGREQELGLVRECWVKAKSGSGQMVVVSGEAGIGKSRITQAAIDDIAKDEHTRITYQCSPYHTDSAFHPVIQQMVYAAGFQVNDEVEIQLDRLEDLIGAGHESLALLAVLLGIDAGERYGVLDLTPAQIRARTMQALVSLLVQQAETKPLLVVFEDLHWVDPTTLELLDLTLDAITGKNILILATARPTFEHGFGGHPIVTRFVLNRLGEEQILSIVGKLTGGKKLPDEVLQIIASRTDGVPLFVEELTKTILETSLLKQEGDRLVLNGPLNSLAIPSTLHDSLMARLDRLQSIKEVAQTAACIGREFNHQLLASISPLTEVELNTALQGLIKAELIYRRGLPPEATYLFKHALVRDAAYESLLKEHRRGIHARILGALETAPDIAPEVLAYHAEAAGLTDHAIDLWEAASKAALARPAYNECISQLNHAIALITPKIEDAEHTVTEHALGLQVQLGVASLQGNGYAANETKAAFERALVLSDMIGETPMRYQVLYGLWVGMYVRADHAEALKQANALLRLAEKSLDTAPRVVAMRLVGVSLFMHGRLVEAEKHFQEAFTLYDPNECKGLENRFGQDIGVATHVYLAWNASLLGETSNANKHAIEAERSALATGHINTICYMHAHRFIAALITNDEDDVKRHLAAQALLAQEYKLVLWQHYATVGQELIRAGQGDPAGINGYFQADSNVTATGTKAFLTAFRVEAARRALAMGLKDQADNLATMAEDMMDATGEIYALSDLYRLKGALALDRGNVQAAETCLKTAIEVAKQQGSPMWELRAAIDLARLWHEAGRTDQATALLKPVYDSIAEGDCPKDRAAARDLLSVLAS